MGKFVTIINEDNYILDDPYFKIKEPRHNLIRTRCQIALAKDALAKESAMDAMIRECAKRYPKA